MQSVTIHGTALKVTTNIESDVELVPEQKGNASYGTQWHKDGVSKTLFDVDGIQCHQFAPLNDFLDEMMKGDAFDRRVAREQPRMLLMAHYLNEYTEETEYQIYRNQQASWLLGYGIFNAHIYGDYYYNKKTGERTKEAKGINPYDDWERVTDNVMRSTNNFMVASGGNFSQVLMEPWYVHVPEDPSKRYQTFLNGMLKRTKRNLINKAATLRGLDGKENPISGRS